MWLLVVLSTVSYSAETKHTTYDVYKTREQCIVASKQIAKKFVLDESTLCVYSPQLVDPKPKSLPVKIIKK
jgi:hypothetical protein